MSFIDTIDAGIDRLSSFVFYTISIGGVDIQLIVLWLAIAMVFMTFWLGVPQVRGFSESWRILRGKYWDPSAPGEVSQFAALATALARLGIAPAKAAALSADWSPPAEEMLPRGPRAVAKVP